MAKVKIEGNASGTGTFTIAAPNSNTDRVLTLPDEAGTVLTKTAGEDFSLYEDTGTTAKFFWDASAESLGIGTSSPVGALTIGDGQISSLVSGTFNIFGSTGTAGNANYVTYSFTDDVDTGMYRSGANTLNFATGASERMRIDSNGTVKIGTTLNLIGGSTGLIVSSDSAGSVGHFNRSGDGGVVRFGVNGTEQGSISISGSTTSYNGGHLARYSRLEDDSKDTSIVKGTVMTNLDEMVVWSHDAVAEVLDEEGNVVTEAKEAYIEDNEQLNKMAVSSVEGDPNVAGVFVSWDNEDDFNDMNIAMTGDMVIRIAQGTTVARGDLLMSAGDGTAKPQGDDIVRSKTIAKVTSTHVSHTYDDGSYLVPCVLMAC